MLQKLKHPLEFRGGGGLSVIITGIVFVMILCFMKCDAYAMTRHTIPRRIEGLGAYYPGNDFGRQVDLSMKTYVRHEWHGVAGTTKVCTYESPTVANTKGSMLFLVPTNRVAFDYQDALDIYFNDVGYFQGRALNARIHFDHIRYGPYTENGKYSISYSSNPTGFFLLQPYNGPELFFGRSDQQEWFPGFEQRYDAKKDIQMTLIITYADTGQVCEIPFYQYVDELDDNNVWNTYGAQEGVTFGNGFKDDLYVYDVFRSEVIGRTVQAPNDGKNHNYSDFYMPPPEPGATSGERKSNDKRVWEAAMFCDACWAVTDNGRFTVTFHGANAVANMNVRSPWITSRIRGVYKSAISSAADAGLTHWRLKQYLPILGEELLHPFTSLRIEDVIPVEQRYEKCEVVNEDGEDITSSMTISYDSVSRKLVISPKSSFLSDRNNYGKSFVAKVYVSWVNDNVKTARNSAQTTIDGVPLNPTPKIEMKVPKQPKCGIGLYKEVLNPKSSYGPGDIVEFMVVIDAASYEEASFSDQDIMAVYNFDRPSLRIHWWRWWVMKDFSFSDVVPKGLELIGEPEVVHRYITRRWNSQSNAEKEPIKQTNAWLWEYNEDGTRKHVEPTYENFKRMQALEHWIVGIENPNDASCNVKGDYIDSDGIFSHDVIRDDLLLHRYSTSLQEVFDKKYTYNYVYRKYYEGRVEMGELDPGIHNRAPDDVLYLDDYGFDVDVSGKGISVKAIGDTVWNGRRLYKEREIYRYGTEVENESQIVELPLPSLGLMGIYYKCRVTGELTNVDVTNTSDVSCVSQMMVMDQPFRFYGQSSNPGFLRYRMDPRLGVEVSAKADATVHLGGYEVTTEVVNGRISDSMYDLDAGSDVDVTYQPKGGYYLESVEVDRKQVPLSENGSICRFKDLHQSHHVKVVYAPGYNITTEAVHGRIDAPILGIRAGENRTVHYEPEDGYMLSTVEIDGVLVNISTCLSQYLFTDVQKDHHIKVTYIPKYKIETSIEHGMITPTITGIAPGSSETVTYVPDSGYYVKSVTVDGVRLTGDTFRSYLSSYTFTNIREDHRIHVVCAPYPTITVTKEIEDVNKIVWAKGYPVFTFMISGTNYLGNVVLYTREIAFSPSDGKSKSITMRIPAGIWTVSELQSDGWLQVSVRAGNSCTVNGNGGVLDTRNADVASVTFVNRVDDWSKYTENDHKINQLK